MKNNEKIYLSKEGYNQYLKELEELKEKLKINGREKTSAYVSAVGDGWHDNFEFENAKREEFKIMRDLREKTEGLSKIVIIDKEAEQKDLVDIDDYVSVDMYFEDNTQDKELFKLIAANTPNMNSDIPEVSLNSPLGRAVYQKKIGEKNYYIVNKNRIDITITGKYKDIAKVKEHVLKMGK